METEDRSGPEGTPRPSDEQSEPSQSVSQPAPQASAEMPPDEVQTEARLAAIPPLPLRNEGEGEEPRRPATWDGRAPVSRGSGERAHLQRRRRRYIFYLRRTARARQSARSMTAARAMWATSIVLLALTISVVTASVGAAASYYQTQVAAVDGLSRTVASRDSVRIYDSKNVLLYQFNDAGAQHSVPLSKVNVHVVNATVAIEDRTFWDNQGIDFASIARAAIANVQQGRITQGGSTITQQLIKQNLLSSNETFDRKLREAILSIGITTQGTYTKRQILEMYLNSIPYGQEAYGIDEAARAYFSLQDDPASGMTAAQQLTLAQASMLAGIPQNPNLNDPLRYFERAHGRQRDVLNAMVTSGYITAAQADAAYTEAGKPGFLKPRTANVNLAPHFVDFVRRQLQQMIDAGQLRLSRSGLNVYTTLDLEMQNVTQQAMKDHLYGNDPNGYGSLLRLQNVTNTAGMLVDHHTGSIKVMLGSVDYNNTQINGKFNVVVDGRRGPGSSFKPIVYATAFEKGWFPALTVSDMPSVFWDAGQGKPYKPLNFNYREFWGDVTLRTALQNSLNIPAVKVMQYAGIDDVKLNAQRWGIRSWNGTWGLSSVLGSLDVSVYDMVQVYTVFANYGQFIPLHSIDRITDSSGGVLFQYQVPQPVQVLSPQVAFLLTSILSDNQARAREFGACSQLYLDRDLIGDCNYYRFNPDPRPGSWPSPNAWPAAAKTGTGQNFTDDWTLGYTMDYTMGVWTGNNDYSPMGQVSGVDGAAPIWHKAMVYAQSNLPARPFPVPQGVHQATYTSNGVTTTDWFLDGPAPQPNIGNTGPRTQPCITFNLYDPKKDMWDYCTVQQPQATPTPRRSNQNGQR